jgi:hypothetical protein
MKSTLIGLNLKIKTILVQHKINTKNVRSLRPLQILPKTNRHSKFKVTPKTTTT